MKKSKLYLTPAERKGFIVLILFILISHSGTLIYEKLFSFSEKEKYDILNRLLIQDSLKLVSQENLSGAIHIPYEILNKFDPNIIDTEMLPYYGFSDVTISNLEKYRKSGGQFKYKEDLLKIYSIDTSIFYKNYSLYSIPGLDEPKVEYEEAIMIKNQISGSMNSEDVAPLLVEFDPNSTDKQTLINNGFSSFAAENLKSYISQGGRINTPGELLKIYGVDSSLFYQISPLIVISELPGAHDQLASSSDSSSPDSSLVRQNMILDINQATSKSLLDIKGIGPYLSKAIVEYREKLGGYYHISQLLEIYALREETFEQIKNNIKVEGAVKKIYPPDLSFKNLLKHPYINYEQTKLLKNIPLTRFDETIKTLIDEGQLDQRLLPYIHIQDPKKDSLE